MLLFMNIIIISSSISTSSNYGRVASSIVGVVYEANYRENKSSNCCVKRQFDKHLLLVSNTSATTSDVNLSLIKPHCISI